MSPVRTVMLTIVARKTELTVGERGSLTQPLTGCSIGDLCTTPELTGTRSGTLAT